MGKPEKRHFIKGNPMLGSYAAPGPAHPLPRDLVNHLLLPFDQVYWKREGHAIQPRPNRPVAKAIRRVTAKRGLEAAFITEARQSSVWQMAAA